MKKLAEEFSNVKRSALVVSSKAPFFEWVQSIYPDEDNSAVYQDPDVYLLPDYETPEEMERWLKRNFEWIFCEQLNNWCTEENRWPPKLTFKMFKEWFNYSLHTMVWDSVAGPIDKFGDAF